MRMRHARFGTAWTNGRSESRGGGGRGWAGGTRMGGAHSNGSAKGGGSVCGRIGRHPLTAPTVAARPTHLLHPPSLPHSYALSAQFVRRPPAAPTAVGHGPPPLPTHSPLPTHYTHHNPRSAPTAAGNFHHLLTFASACIRVLASGTHCPHPPPTPQMEHTAV